MEPRYRRLSIQAAFVLTVVCLFTSICASQAGTSQSKAVNTPDAFSQALNKYPGLLPELSHLLDRLKREIQFPAERRQSDLMPVLPASTTFYAGFPNFGEPVHQAMTIFNDELKQSPALRDWWQQSDMAKTGPQVEMSIEKFYELSQYLGDEMVIAGDTESSAPSAVFVTEVRKPGLKAFLQQMLKELPDKSTTNVRVLDLEDLANAKEEDPKVHGLVVLIRPDLAIVGADLNSVRKLSQRLDSKSGDLASSLFGQRLAKAYEGGVSVVAAADLHKIVGKLPAGKPEGQQALERSGFKDVKYLVWDHKSVNNQSLGEMEISFTGPRRGAASWLAAPALIGGLEFVSPKSVVAVSVRLKNLGEVYDDIQQFGAGSNPNALATIPQMEQAMHINLKDDLLSQLQGEITFALTDFKAPQPEWKAILRVNDADRLQKTLNKLLQATPVVARQSEEEGVTYHSLTVPSAQKPLQIVYAFVDGYLVVGSSHDAATEAVQLHKGGESLAKSAKFREAFPPGYPREVSAVVYEDASAMTAFRLRQLSPDMAEAMSHLTPASTPIVFCAYGEERAIRGVSAGSGADASAILVGAAIAIPNMMRAKTAANESAAVGALRAINVAQTTYSYKYLQNGYARDLASLGPDPRGSGLKTANHAGLIDADLGSASCISGAWCEKAGYRFSIAGVCRLRSCKEFVVVATPVASASGSRNFCSTSDAVIRFEVGPPLISPVSAEECRQWAPLQ